MANQKSTACVIGAGIGGIATALRLAAKGYHVSVFEKSDAPGGKMSQLTSKGYRFDMGPSLFTLPHLLDELFALFGKKREDYVDLLSLPVTCNYFFSDGSNLRAWSNFTDFRKELDEKGFDTAGVEKYLEKQAFKYNHTADFFLFNSIHKSSALVSDAGMKSLKVLHRMDAFLTMHQRNKKSFGNSNLVQLFNRYATYNGSNPYKAPATLNMIAHLEHNTGAYLPRGGMYEIVSALLKLAKEAEVQFLYNTEVTGLVTKGNEVSGVRTNDCIYPASVVVSNFDITLFYRDILPREHRFKKLMKRERSSSALIFYWGMKLSSGLDVHNIFFSYDYKAEFDGLFKTKTLANDLTVYVYISSKVNLADAPHGCENWFVMVNAPENVGQNWDDETANARRIIIDKLNKTLNLDIESFIETETIVTPPDIEERTGSVNGSIYGHSSNSPLAAFMRHPNFSRQYKNLYFTGGSVHPGGGIPLCLASAKIVDSLVKVQI